MGKKRLPGLQKRWGLWHIDKIISGQRLCESTGTGELKEAERYLARRLEEIRQAKVYGMRPSRSFREAATKYLLENQHKASIHSDAQRLRTLDAFIGDLPLQSIHIGTLKMYIEARRKEGRKTRTINHGLKVVRHILNLASSEWIDEYGLTWLQAAPKIKLIPEYDNRAPYPLSWEEQTRLFAALPDHLRHMALFAVNTGCRDQEVCQLKWAWETRIAELDNVSVFIIPAFVYKAGQCKQMVKNKQDRLVVLNQTAQKVADDLRANRNGEYVFTYRGRPLYRMNNSGWQKARESVGLPQVRVHDLKHTFGCRLRAAGVSFEDRQDLLGHKSTRITTHYSAAEIGNLLEAANKVCITQHNTPTLTILRKCS